MTLRRREFSLVAASMLAAPSLVLSQTKSLAALHDLARKEGELTWYTVPQTSEIAERMGRTFTERYPGIKVNVVRTTAQVAFQRLNQDLRASSPNCDVFTSTDLSHYVDLKGRNLLLKYRPQAVAGQDKRVQNMDPDDYFHASSCFMMGLIYNTKKVTAAEAPKSWADLLDPKWNGVGLVAHPAYSGASGAWGIEMHKLYGDAFFKKLAANKTHVSRSTIDAVTAVISGESLVSAGPMSLASRAGSKGNPVATVAPKEGPVVILSPSAIMASTRRPNASKLFMEWMMGSEDTEKISIEEFGVPLRANSKPREGVIGLNDSGPLLVPTALAMVTQLPKVVEAWREAFGV